MIIFLKVNIIGVMTGTEIALERMKKVSVFTIPFMCFREAFL